MEFVNTGLGGLKRERVATKCVCCESNQLKKSPAILMPFVADRAFGWKPLFIDDTWGLKDIKKGNAYAICNSLYCLECALLFLDIRFSEEELNYIYSGYRNKVYTDLRESYEPGYSEKNNSLNNGINYIKKIEAFLTPHLSFPLSILDWGGDTGKNTPFKNNNKTFHIFDISSKSVIEGAEAVDRNTVFSARYDLIVCSNVLEHIPYPSELIFDIKKAMAEDTILYIEVPLEDIIRKASPGEDLSRLKKHWHEHINFYSDKSLLSLLNLCGLEVLQIEKINSSAGGSASFAIQIACRIIK